MYWQYVNVIFKYQKHFVFFNVKDAFKLSDSMVKPILRTYTSEIWDHILLSTDRKFHSLITSLTLWKYIFEQFLDKSKCVALRSYTNENNIMN